MTENGVTDFTAILFNQQHMLWRSSEKKQITQEDRHDKRNLVPLFCRVESCHQPKQQTEIWVWSNQIKSNQVLTGYEKCNMSCWQ